MRHVKRSCSSVPSPLHTRQHLPQFGSVFEWIGCWICTKKSQEIGPTMTRRPNKPMSPLSRQRRTSYYYANSCCTREGRGGSRLILSLGPLSLLLLLLSPGGDDTVTSVAAYAPAPYFHRYCPPKAARAARSSAEYCTSILNSNASGANRYYKHQHQQQQPVLATTRASSVFASTMPPESYCPSGYGDGGVGRKQRGWGTRECSSNRLRRKRRNLSLCRMAGSEDHSKASGGGGVGEEKLELAAEVVGAMTKAAVGVAVNRAAATVSEEQGLPLAKQRVASTAAGGRADAPGSKRKAFASLLSNLVMFLRAEDGMGFSGQGKAWDSYLGTNSTRSIMDNHHPHLPSPSSLPSNAGVETVGGVMVNGYWFPSLAAAAQAPAGRGFDFAAATAEAAAEAARAKRKRKRLLAERRRLQEARHPKGVDFSCGAMRISTPSFISGEMDVISAAAVAAADITISGDGSRRGGTASPAAAAGTGQQLLPFWRRWTVKLIERTSATQRIQQAVRDYVPRMPQEALMLVVGVAGGELAKREITAQVEALEEPVRGPAWALLNETYRNIETRASELVESDWDVAALFTKELADWKRRGVGNSYQEALLKEVLQLQTQALLKPIVLPAEEGSLMVQLNATYRSIEESLGRLLPEQTKEQLSLLEGLARKLDDKGLGELSFDEVYRALLLGAVPPTLVSDAVRLLAAGRPGEGGGAGFLSNGAGGVMSYRDGGQDVTLASLAARLNDTRAMSRVMTYTALAAETEVIENLREVLDGLQTNIRTTLLDLESDLVLSEEAAQSSLLQDAAMYVNQAARSAIAFAIDGFNNASKVFDASFEALAEPSRRTVLKSSSLVSPWQALYQVWTNTTVFNTITSEDHHLSISSEGMLSSATLPPSGNTDLAAPSHTDEQAWAPGSGILSLPPKGLSAVSVLGGASDDGGDGDGDGDGDDGDGDGDDGDGDGDDGDDGSNSNSKGRGGVVVGGTSRAARMGVGKGLIAKRPIRGSGSVGHSDRGVVSDADRGRGRGGLLGWWGSKKREPLVPLSSRQVPRYSGSSGVRQSFALTEHAKRGPVDDCFGVAVGVAGSDGDGGRLVGGCVVGSSLGEARKEEDEVVEERGKGKGEYRWRRWKNGGEKRTGR